MTRALVTAFAVVISLVGPARAEVPDWVKPHLQADASSIAGAEGAVVLVSTGEARYTSPDSVRHTYRQAVKVLAEAGRSRLTAVCGYNSDHARIVSARAWIIDPSGKRAEEIKRREFTDVVANPSALFWNSSRALAFNAGSRAVVGSTLAWEFVEESQGGVFDVHWAFRERLPVWTSSFEVIPPAGATLRWRRSHSRVPDPVAGPGGSLRWTMSRLLTSGLPTPDGFQLDELEVTARADTAARKEGVLDSWDAFSRLVSAIIEPRIESTDAVRSLAAELTAGRAARWERIRALCDFAQRDVQYFSLTLDRDYLAGYRPHASSEVIRNRVGDCKDKAALLVALLRAIDERGYFVLVHARDRLAISDDWPTTGFNHAIAAIPADADTPPHWPIVEAGALGRLVLFDPTHPGVPLGALPSSDQGRFVLVTARDTGACVRSPVETPADARIERTIDARIERSGALEVKATQLVPGAAGSELHFRRTTLRAERFTQEIAEFLQRSLPAVEALQWTDTWDASRPAFAIELGFRVPRFVRIVGRGQWLVRPQVVADPAVLEPWTTPLEGSAWLPTWSVRQTTRLALPDGVEPESLPAEFRCVESGFSARCTYRHEPGVIVSEIEIERPARFIDREDYEVWRAAHQRLDEALKTPVMLRPVAPPTAAAP